MRELSGLADEVGGELVFLVHACVALAQLDEVAEVVRCLDGAGHDVHLRAHPEYLPKTFWRKHGFKYRPRFLSQYADDKGAFTIKHFGKFISDLKVKLMLAFRAESFHWNADTIRAFGAAGIPLSFNNSMSADLEVQYTYSEATNKPYVWSNAVIEVPSPERRFYSAFGNDWWERLQFPVLQDWRNPTWRVLWPHTAGRDISFLVLLLHSWSLLYWDENDHATYRDDKRLKEFDKLMCKLAKDYDIITTADFLDPYACNKIKTTHTVDLYPAEMKPPAGMAK